MLNIYEDAEKNVIILNYLMNWTAKSTGRNFRMPAIEVLTFRDAKIAKLEFYPPECQRRWLTRSSPCPLMADP
jgi:ketosteroid isomerase-like protein